MLRDHRAGWPSEPVPVDFLTAAAPNHGRHAGGVGGVGLWGVGNRPEVVAAAFAKHLKGDFAGVFDRVVFAVSDRDPGVRRPFEEAFDERMER
ncbi:hypothetical protein BDW27_12223 [Nocardiopsis sp. L17-MgMaSL7]|nr:hypothetical protein BDW27_12223 [Nocardiopsis sp. L17-MgMaSL7]